MGIPSYFKHILDRYKYLLKPADNTTKATTLLVDFNCLIYGCIRAPTMPIYTYEGRVEWEATLLKHIREYVLEIWVTAGKPAEVYLAVDGVVPMAKIRQQRLRRFKSAWMAGQELALGVRGEETWDTNSITPGTAFMEKLSVELGTLCSKHGWILSGAEHEGEGEQKLMQWIRSRPGDLAGKNIFVYGLDADLIILSMLHAGTGAGTAAQWSILREKQEFGKLGALSLNKFLLLNVTKMVEVLFPDVEQRTAYLYDYVAGMCLLGNDFVPHNLGVSLREHGHDRLEAALRDLHADGLRLLVKEDGKYTWNKPALEKILASWAATESEDHLAAFKQKYKMRGPTPRSDTEWKLAPLQNLPIESADEKRLWDTESLLDGWKQQYYTEGGSLVSGRDVEERSKEYLTGLQWIIDYYTGQREPSWEWMYPWTYPPLWSDLLKYSEGRKALPVPPVQLVKRLQPQEQLSLVLPLESWGLIRNMSLKMLPTKAPTFWPAKFQFMSLGKRWLWECPPQIPIMSVARLRSLLC